MMSKESWCIHNTDMSFDNMRDKNTVFTVSNGYYALKGNVHEYKYVDYPATYIAGVWGVCPIFNLESPTQYKRVYHDYSKYDTARDGISIANLPDPLFFELYAEDIMLTFKQGKVADFVQTYHLDTGLYEYSYVLALPDGKKTSVRMCRFADMENLHRAYMRYTITPLNYGGELTVKSGVAGDTKSNLLHEKQYEVTGCECVDGTVCRMAVRTFPCGHDAQFYTAHQTENLCTQRTFFEEDKIYQSFCFQARQGMPVIIDKFIVLCSGEDEKYDAYLDNPLNEVVDSVFEGFARAYDRQVIYWKEKWARYDVQIEGDALAQTYMRFCLFHLICGVPKHTERLFMPVKLLTGDHYQGTAFYDTDLYIEPVFLTLEPQLCKSLISFRWHILNKSREIAKKSGYPGAKYAWQVSPWGEEVLGSWWILKDTNIHLNVDICYSIMQYYYQTGDLAFIKDRAIDIMIEVSRYMFARLDYEKEKDCYHLRGVAGPDESHCRSTDNFYTNYLTRQCFANTLLLLRKIKQSDESAYKEIKERLAVVAEELAHFEDASNKLMLIYHEDTKLYEQCEGFFDLPLIPQKRWDKFKIENKPKAGMWFADLDKYSQTNQPDASALIWMYPEHFDRETYEKNFRFYDERNLNFSSMSYVVNSMMAKETGDIKRAYHDFIITAGMDVDSSLTKRMDTRAGLHGTALGGAFMAVVQGFAGVRATANGLSVNPCLPQQWTQVSFYYYYLGHRLLFIVKPGEIIIDTTTLPENVELTLKVAGKEQFLKGSGIFVFPY